MRPSARSSSSQLRMRPASKHLGRRTRDHACLGDQLCLGVQRLAQQRLLDERMAVGVRRYADPLESVVVGEQVTEERKPVGVRAVRLFGIASDHEQVAQAVLTDPRRQLEHLVGALDHPRRDVRDRMVTEVEQPGGEVECGRDALGRRASPTPPTIRATPRSPRRRSSSAPARIALSRSPGGGPRPSPDRAPGRSSNSRFNRNIDLFSVSSGDSGERIEQLGLATIDELDQFGVDCVVDGGWLVGVERPPQPAGALGGVEPAVLEPLLEAGVVGRVER